MFVRGKGNAVNGTLADLMHESRNGIPTRRGFVTKAGSLGLSSAGAALANTTQAQTLGAQGTDAMALSPAEMIWGPVASGAWEVVDLSVTTAHGHPTNWPTDPLFLQRLMASMGPPLVSDTGYVVAGGSIVNVNAYELTAHTGTQIDVPPRFLPKPGVTVGAVTGNE